MAYTMNDVRICLNNVNDLLKELGCDKELRIQTHNDGGGRSRRLIMSDYREVGGRFTPNELGKALDLFEDILRNI
mgnify:CR=1 FL=1